MIGRDRRFPAPAHAGCCYSIFRDCVVTATNADFRVPRLRKSVNRKHTSTVPWPCATAHLMTPITSFRISRAVNWILDADIKGDRHGSANPA